MAQRFVNTYTISQRREAQHDVVAPDDLSLSLTGSWPAEPLPAGTLPYCADLARERALFTTHDEAGLAKLLAAAFMFNDQLETATGAISVPFEQLDEAIAPPPAPPVLVFSPGRTGSTLLVRLLAAAGLACASEPDMLTQLARAPREAFALLPPGTREALARACLAQLGHTLGGGVIVKLRSQCNARPLLLTGAAPGCRVVFMLRGVAGWALSRHRSFLEPPETVAAILRQAIDALDKLAFCGAAFDVLWFETLAADPAAALRICAPGLAFDADVLGAVMARDSQAGTMIAREHVASSPAQDGFMAQLARDWREARAGAEWHPATEALVGEVWEK